MVSHFAKIKLVAVLVCGLLLSACEKEIAPPKLEQKIELPTPQVVQTAMDALARHALKQDKQTQKLAAELKQRIGDFLKEPIDANLDAARESWLKAHEAYLVNQLGLWADPQNHFLLNFNIDAWPIQPGFIDSLPLYPDSGIVNDITLDITPQSLRQQHGVTDTEEVCLGFHALEYLLFQRPIADFQENPASPKNAIIKRRRAVLRIAAHLLTQDVGLFSAAIKKQFDAETSITAYEQLHAWIQNSRRYLQGAFRESNFLIDESAGHSVYSNSSEQSLLAVISALQQSAGKNGKLNKVLKGLNAKETQDFFATLERTQKLLENPAAEEAEGVDLPLLLSGLLQQLETFEAKVSYAIESRAYL